MTVPAANTTYRYEGNGVTTIFAYSNRLLTEDDVRVQILTRATDAVVETLTKTTDYTVTLVSNSLANITITNATKIPSVTQDILLTLDLDISQTRSYPRADSLPAADIERGLDKLTLIAQKLDDGQTLTLRFPESDTASDGELPSAANRASKYLAFNASGEPVVSEGTDTITSAYGLTLVQADDAAEARTILGVESVPYTAASASGAASLQFAEDTDNGTNKVTLAAPAALAADRFITLPDAAGEITLNTATQTLTNKTLPNPTLVDTSDNTKGINFDFTGASAGAIGTLVGWFTNDRTITIQDSTGTLALTSQLGGTLATPQNSTSGTSIDFTGIPAGTKQIFMTWDGVSTNGTDQILIQLGDSGGVEATGYTGVNYDTSSSTTFSIGFPDNTSGAAFLRYAHWEFTLLDSSTNTWVCKGHIGFNNSGSYGTRFTVGSKSLSATLDRIRVTTSGGTNTFDAGKINILYS